MRASEKWKLGLEIIFCNLFTCLYVVRLTILCAFVVLLTSAILGADHWLPGEWPILPVFIMIHHTASVYKLPFVPGLLDLFFVLAEGIATGYLAARISIEPYFPEVLVVHSVISWSLVGCLFLLLVFRLAKVIRTRGKSLCTGVDVFAHMWPATETEHPNILRLLFGRAFQREHFVGETKAIQVLRAVLGLLFALSIIFYGALHIIFNPIQETALTPVQESRARILPQETAGKLNVLGFNVMIPVFLGDVKGQQLLSEAVTVEALWGLGDNLPVCVTGLLELPKSQQQAPKSVTAISYQCNPESNGNTTVPPAILITVDFSLLQQAGGSEPLAYDSRSNALSLVVGLSIPNSIDVEDLLTQNPVLSLAGGVNLLGALTTDVREVFTTPALAAVGLYQTSTVFLTPRFLSLYPDPEPSAFLRSPNISTLRLEVPPFAWAFSELKILSDRRTSSVLEGFASIGGLWTALSGIFAIMFGTSLIHFLYGAKDISILGVAHSFQFEKIRANCLDKYPKLEQDIRNTPNDGLLALIRDHIINLSFLDHHSSDPRSEPPQSQKPSTDEEKGPDYNEHIVPVMRSE